VSLELLRDEDSREGTFSDIRVEIGKEYGLSYTATKLLVRGVFICFEP